MKRIMVLFTVFMLLLATGVYAQSYTGNHESRAPFTSVMDEDFFLDVVQAEGADSTLITLDAAAGAQDTALTKKVFTLGYNFLMPVIVTAETDSTTLKLVVRSGIYNKYTEAYVLTDTDSLTVTSASQTANPPQAISIPGGKVFEVSIRTEDGNAWSQATTLRLWYRRYR